MFYGTLQSNKSEARGPNKRVWGKIYGDCNNSIPELSWIDRFITNTHIIVHVILRRHAVCTYTQSRRAGYTYYKDKGVHGRRKKKSSVVGRQTAYLRAYIYDDVIHGADKNKVWCVCGPAGYDIMYNIILYRVIHQSRSTPFFSNCTCYSIYSDF